MADAMILGAPDLPPELQQLVDQALDRITTIASHPDVPAGLVALGIASARVQAVVADRLISMGGIGLRQQGRLSIGGEKIP